LLLYYITDRSQFSGAEPDRRTCLIERIGDAVGCGIDFIQLREKDLPAHELEALARAVSQTIRASDSPTRLLINSRTDIALAVDAHGVHLRSHDLSPIEVRRIWRAAGPKNEPVVAVSCHTEAEVVDAKENGADFVVFGPVFEKKDSSEVPATGLDQLRSACRHGVPVVALGGVRRQNVHRCTQAGAAGIAGIRLFQEGDLAATVKQLRA
jgi:thiamine-phosphate pyrophosphorylase